MHETRQEPSWIGLATSSSVVVRAVKYAVVVGAILIAINHGDAILKAEITPARALKMLLTVFVPYAVSTLSSVGALRESGSAADQGSLR